MKLREVLRTEKEWTKGVLARDAHGHSQPYYSPKAVAFCIEGAILKTDFANRIQIKARLVTAAKELGFHCFIYLFELNDDCVTFAELCTIIEKAESNASVDAVLPID